MNRSRNREDQVKSVKKKKKEVRKGREGKRTFKADLQNQLMKRPFSPPADLDCRQDTKLLDLAALDITMNLLFTCTVCTVQYKHSQRLTLCGKDTKKPHI